MSNIEFLQYLANKVSKSRVKVKGRSQGESELNERPVVIFSLDYSLAPQSQYPNQRYEAIDAIGYVYSFFDSKQVFLVGSSGGGGLALDSLMDPLLTLKPNGCIVLAPWLDYGRSYTSNPNIGKDKLSQSLIDSIISKWIPPDLQTNLDSISPFFHNSLHKLPPLYIIWGEDEIFAQQNTEFSQKVSRSGVSVTTRQVHGQVHGFMMHVTENFPIVSEEITLIADWIDDHSI